MRLLKRGRLLPFFWYGGEVLKIRVKTGIASHNWSYAPGQEADVDDQIGKAWIESGIAEEGGDDGDKSRNTTTKRAGKSARSKTASKSGRDR